MKKFHFWLVAILLAFTTLLSTPSSSVLADEDNTASNLGAGEGIYAQKVGVDLQFKSLVATNGIGLTSDADTISINFNSLEGVIIGGTVPAAGYFTTLSSTGAYTPSSIGAFTLSGKLTAGASEIEGSAFDINGGTVGLITLDGKLTAGATEIEGSNFDINGGDISAGTVSGGLTWSAAQNLGSQNLTNVNIDSGTIDGVTIGATVAPTVTDLGSVATADINGGTIDGTTIGATTPAAGTFSSATFSGNLDLQNNDLLNVGNASTDITSTTATFATNVTILGTNFGLGATSDADRFTQYVYEIDDVTTGAMEIVSSGGGPQNGALMFVSGRGEGAAGNFIDLIITAFDINPTVIVSKEVSATAAARTYTTGGGYAVDLEMASGIYNVSVWILTGRNNN